MLAGQLERDSGCELLCFRLQLPPAVWHSLDKACRLAVISKCAVTAFNTLLFVFTYLSAANLHFPVRPCKVKIGSEVRVAFPSSGTA